MATIKDAASEFLAHKRVAVTGVSRTPGSHGSNAVYKRLRGRGSQRGAPRAHRDPSWRGRRGGQGQAGRWRPWAHDTWAAEGWSNYTARSTA